MKIREFQKKIADALNTVEELVQGGCRAFAEDALTVVNDVAQQLQMARGVAVVVTTPRFARSASGCADGIPAECQLEVKCLEKPAINREAPGHLTALDAAEEVAHALDGETLEFASIEQYVEERTGTVVVTVAFGVDILLTQEEGD